jgi:hypothetical protein
MFQGLGFVVYFDGAAGQRAESAGGQPRTNLQGSGF